MKKSLIIAALVTMPVTLSGCDKKADAPKSEASTDAIGNMAMPADAKWAMASEQSSPLTRRLAKSRSITRLLPP